MKARIGWIAVAMTLLLATPVAARPKDPSGFQMMRAQQHACQQRTSFGDPPAVNCMADAPEQAAIQPVSWPPAEAQSLLRIAANALASAGSLQCTLEMRTTTTNIRGGSWTANSTFVGGFAAPDKPRGALTLANP